jgi:hypothetical protein
VPTFQFLSENYLLTPPFPTTPPPPSYLNGYHNLGSPSTHIYLHPWHQTDLSIRELLAVSEVETFVAAGSPHFYDNRLRMLAGRAKGLRRLNIADCVK